MIDLFLFSFATTNAVLCIMLPVGPAEFWASAAGMLWFGMDAIDHIK